MKITEIAFPIIQIEDEREYQALIDLRHVVRLSQEPPVFSTRYSAETDVIAIGLGSKTDVILHATQTGGQSKKDFLMLKRLWMRVQGKEAAMIKPDLSRMGTVLEKNADVVRSIVTKISERFPTPYAEAVILYAVSDHGERPPRDQVSLRDIQNYFYLLDNVMPEGSALLKLLRPMEEAGWVKEDIPTGIGASTWYASGNVHVQINSAILESAAEHLLSGGRYDDGSLFKG